MAGAKKLQALVTPEPLATAGKTPVDTQQRSTDISFIDDLKNMLTNTMKDLISMAPNNKNLTQAVIVAEQKIKESGRTYPVTLEAQQVTTTSKKPGKASTTKIKVKVAKKQSKTSKKIEDAKNETIQAINKVQEKLQEGATQGPDFMSHLSDVSMQAKAESERLLKLYEDMQTQVYDKYQKTIDELRDVVSDHIAYIRDVYRDLLAKKPELSKEKEPIRNLALALLSIASLFSKSDRVYLVTAIPKILEAWKNEDLVEFEKRMKEFSINAELARFGIDVETQALRELSNVIMADAQLNLEQKKLAMNKILEAWKKMYDTYMSTLGMAFDYQKWLFDTMYKTKELQLKEEKLKLEREKLGIEREKVRALIARAMSRASGEGRESTFEKQEKKLLAELLRDPDLLQGATLEDLLALGSVIFREKYGRWPKDDEELLQGLSPYPLGWTIKAAIRGAREKGKGKKSLTEILSTYIHDIIP